jgi:hypothetical protein
VHVDHNFFFTHGWADSDPYAVGWAAWEPVLSGWYAPYIGLFFALLSHWYNAFFGKIKEISRLFLAWIIPFSLYVIYIIAVKPDHYWMPVMIPLFAGIIPMAEFLWSDFLACRKTNPRKATLILVGLVFTVGFLVFQIAFNLKTSWAVFSNVEL